MAAKKDSPKTQPPQGDATIGGTGWQDLLDQLNTSGNFYRPKEGDTNVRLIPLEGMDYESKGFKFWAEVQTTFRGNTRTKYVVPALILTGKGATEAMKTTVTTLVLAKKALKQIIGLLAEGYDLFGPEGFGVKIKRSGQSLDTDYTCLPSKNPVPIDGDEIEGYEQSVDEMAKAFEEWSNRNGISDSDDQGDSDFVEEPRRGGSRPGGFQRGSRRQASEPDF